MPLASIRHPCRRTVTRRPRLPKPAPLASPAVVAALLSVACGEPSSPAVGDTYRLDATAHAVYDCAPGSETPIDAAICGTRVDTVDLDDHGRLQGRLVVVGIDTGDRRRQGSNAGTDPLPRTTISVEGDVQETVCNPDCRTTRGTRRGYIERWPDVCTPATTIAWCAGRLGDSIVVLLVSIVDMDDMFQLGLGGTEDADGRAEHEYVRFEGLVPLGPPPRYGMRFHLRLTRERHFL